MQTTNAFTGRKPNASDTPTGNMPCCCHVVNVNDCDLLVLCHVRISEPITKINLNEYTVSDDDVAQ